MQSTAMGNKLGSAEMDYVQRLLAEWSEHACGLTIDFVGDASSNPQLQWALAVPLENHSVSLSSNFLDRLRTDLSELGLQSVDDSNHDGTARLPNQFSFETECPYRPKSCCGDHLVAAGRGLLNAPGMNVELDTDTPQEP